jgi:hypothetical protein
MKPAEILDLPMQENDAGAATIRDYLIELVKTVWIEGEGFSGKRPFGNSGWEYDLYEPLARAGMVEATFDEDGYMDHCDRAAARELIDSAIAALGDHSGSQSADAPAIRPSMTGRYGKWVLFEKTDAGGSSSGRQRGRYTSLEQAFRMVAAIAPDAKGCWKELVWDTWELGREELDGWERGDWYVSWVTDAA